jgi:hypothetical protein
MDAGSRDERIFSTRFFRAPACRKRRKATRRVQHGDLVPFAKIAHVALCHVQAMLRFLLELLKHVVQQVPTGERGVGRVSQRLARTHTHVKELDMGALRSRHGQRGFKNNRIRITAACRDENSPEHAIPYDGRDQQF